MPSNTTLMFRFLSKAKTKASCWAKKIN